MAETHEVRLKRARVSLEGLSVGDALGGFFEGNRAGSLSHYVKTRKPPAVLWRFTDDTNMALSLFSILRQRGHIDQNLLAANFARHYHRSRGYGMAMHGLLGKIQLGFPWKQTATSLFNGKGSFGNGGAMRVSPLGAYFADDIDMVVEQARLSSEVTHTHPEAIAGAIAVAVATALAWHCCVGKQRPTRTTFIEQVLPYVPDSQVKQGIESAKELPSNIPLWPDVVTTLGNGSMVSAQDTVPLALWSAGEYMDNYEEAIWQTASAGGDVDTTCAMVGGIVAMYTGIEGIPLSWIESREPLPEWAFTE